MAEPSSGGSTNFLYFVVGAGAAERSQSRRPAEPDTSLGAIPGQPQSGMCRKEAPAETLAAGAAEVS